MKQSKIKGIVIKETPVGEADKILTLLTYELGKCSVIAKGAKRSNSRLLSSSQLFAYSEYSIFIGAKLGNVSHAETIESFYEIRKDLFKLSYAMYMLELIDEVALEGLKNEDLIRLLLNTLYILSKKHKDPKFITRIFEVKLVCIAGYMPVVLQCVNCGKDIEKSPYSFSAVLGGVLCPLCLKQDSHSYRISQGTLYSLQYIIHQDLKQIYNFEVSDQVLKELGLLMKKYIGIHFDKSFKTLDFLENLEQ